MTGVPVSPAAGASPDDGLAPAIQGILDVVTGQPGWSLFAGALLVGVLVLRILLAKHWARCRRVRGIDLDPRYGCVYVFRHTARRRLVKIGVTLRDPDARAREVETTMTGGAPVELVMCLYTHPGLLRSACVLHI